MTFNSSHIQRIRHIGIIAFLLGVFLTCSSCASKSYLESITDLPLKTITLPDMNWQRSSMRANAQYALYGANSGKERRSRLGDYYYVRWYDATPQLPTRVEMLYTQAGTASKVLSRVRNYPAPRSGRGRHKILFDFNGPQRARLGDILSWRINLYVNGEQVDSRHSYLWQDKL